MPVSNIDRLEKENNESWGERLGNLAAQELEGITDELEIREITLKYWEPIRNEITNDKTIKRPRTAFVKAIKAKFPNSLEEKPGYYFTKPRGEDEQWVHLADWYATSNKERWDVIGNEARENHKNSFKNNSVETVEVVELVGTVERVKAVEVVETVETSLPTLDDDTQKLVDEAIFSSGQSFNEFYQNAMKAYANSLLAKKRQIEDDLSSISTQELLSNPKYKTHSGRVQELTNRAVQAIMDYNDNCTEKAQKWLITQSIIQSLIKSRPSAIKEALEYWKQRIEDHHNKHELTNLLHNRSQKLEIGDVIKLPEFGSN